MPHYTLAIFIPDSIAIVNFVAAGERRGSRQLTAGSKKLGSGARRIKSQFLAGCTLPAINCLLSIAHRAIDSDGSPSSLIDSDDFLEEGLIRDVSTR